MPINIELVFTGIGLIISVCGVGWTIATRIGKVETTLEHIRALLHHHAVNIEKIEKDLHELKKDFHNHELTKHS